jgi:transcriptional regulator with XRE-family HTH domain
MGGLAMTELLRFIRAEQPETKGEPLHYKACGLDDVYLFNGFKIEKIDGDEFVTIEDLDGLWKAIGLYLVTMRKGLAPKEIRFLRHHMNYTQAELAARMRVTDQTVARWEKGSDLPGPEDLLLRVLFLSSKIAQPEGKTLLAHFPKLSDQIIERDEPEAKPTLFEHEHDKKKWRESKRVLEVA